MKTLRNLATRAAGTPLIADEVLEFHAGRILLLLAICGGRRGVINSLTKMAKLDFFVRYPNFFEAITPYGKGSPRREYAIEAAMVRHHYGPWDKRYYHVLAFLEARSLIAIRKSGKSTRLSLTRKGRTVASRLFASLPFSKLRQHIESVALHLGDKTGNELKTMIYSAFNEEVGRRPLGKIIE